MATPPTHSQVLDGEGLVEPHVLPHLLLLLPDDLVRPRVAGVVGPGDQEVLGVAGQEADEQEREERDGEEDDHELGQLAGDRLEDAGGVGAHGVDPSVGDCYSVTQMP